MFSIPIHSLEQRTAFIDRLARRPDSLAHRAGDEPNAPIGVRAARLVRVGGGRILRRGAAVSVASGVASTSTVEVNFAALAGAFARRLHDVDAFTVTSDQSERYARALALTTPRSRRSLYLTTRSIFVTDVEHVAAFNRVFAEVFGAPAGTDRHREGEIARVLAPA
jgi:uncharacterized protein with von Willebrand factor type A (vWA) domain